VGKMAEIVEVYSAAEIADRVRTVALDIARTHSEGPLSILGVLEDSFVFLADLLRALTASPQTAFLRYDHQSLGGIQDISFSTPMDVSGRDVILVEGVLETGVPQEYLIKQLGAHGAKSVRLCVLVDKPDGRRVALEPDWRIFETRESYVFGYGLGFNGRWRELPYLATFAGKGED
jgi:hypoxanthine phosphoribosyltransferase